MLRLRVREVAERQGVYEATVLARRADINTETAYRLWRGDAGSTGRGVGIQTLHKVARAMGVKLEALYEEIEGE